MLIDIGYVGDWFAALVDDEAGTTLIWELIDAFGRDDFDELDLPIFGGDLWQIVIDQSAELITILIKMQYNKVLCWGISNFPDILIP